MADSAPLKGLRYQRTAIGLTLKQTAALIGVDAAALSRMERGLMPLTIDRAAIIANHFGCSIDDLL